jgi:glycosyltransferase involved in cell wall biosynthesis
MTDIKQRSNLKYSKVMKKDIDIILKNYREQYLRTIHETQKGKKRTKIVACIPAYNEEKSIASVILRTSKYVDYVIVCDDGSTDMTSEIAEKVGAYVVSHDENLGKGAALKTAFLRALELEPDYIVVLDGDGQHLPEEIPKLITPLEKNEADIVIGSRYLNEKLQEIPYYRKVGHKIIGQVFNRNINDQVKDSQSGFRAYNGEALLHLITAKSNGFGIEVEQISIATKNELRIQEVEAKIKYHNIENTSKKSPLFHGTEILLSILNLVISERPLELLALPGFISIMIGLLSLSLFFYYFNSAGYFSLPYAIISTATIIFGTLLILVALVLYAIREVEK